MHNSFHDDPSPESAQGPNPTPSETDRDSLSPDMLALTLRLSCARLKAAVTNCEDGGSIGEIMSARKQLSDVALRLREAGYWPDNREKLREVTALLWEADRCINADALSGPKSTEE